MAGKITPNETTDTDSTKAVQVKVPVVATVIQNIEPDGKSNFVVEPPSVEQEQGEARVDLARYWSLIYTTQQKYFLLIYC